MKNKKGEQINISDIELLMSKFLFKVIDENIPYVLVAAEEPFINQYNGSISYDYSGEVELMTNKHLKDIKEESFSLENFLSEIYIDQWMATYVSNYGKAWINYKDLLERYFNEWKYENFDLYDEDGNELNENLEDELNDIFYEFLQKDLVDIYYQKIFNSIKDNK